jgi:preprotein translocase subunit SecE
LIDYAVWLCRLTGFAEFASRLQTILPFEMDKIKLYFQESYNELVTKVTWPTWPNLQSTTVVVLLGLLIFTLCVFIMDSASKGLMDGLIYKLRS